MKTILRRLREAVLWPVRLPLHYQILMALVVGTVVGILVNPGDVRLPDVRITVSRTDEQVTAITRGPEGAVLREETLAVEAFRSRYPVLAGRTLVPEPGETLTVAVTERSIFIAEGRDEITIRYSARVDGRSTMATFQARNAAALAEKYPRWAPVYREHGGGVAAGVMAGSEYAGDLFLRLLKMITVPLILTSLVSGVAGLGSTARFGSLFGKTLLYYLATSALAITTGLVMVNVIRPGVGAELPGTTAEATEALPEPGENTVTGVLLRLLENMFPENPVEALATADFLSIIVFSILLGIFIIYTGGTAAERLRGLFEAGFEVMMRMTMFIIRLAPIGVLAFMVYATASQGLEVFRSLAWYMLAVFLALVVHATVVLPALLFFVARRSPLGYFQAMSPALMTAFSTASSNGTLPLTMTCVEERAGVSNEVSSFVLPLGATVNMDGTALYEAVAVLFIAQAAAAADPTFTFTLGSQVLVAVTALLASVGAAGIPHAGLVMMAIVLQAVGLPLQAQGVILAVDRILDMCRTSVNVWSDSCGCAVVARFQETDDGTPAPAESGAAEPTAAL